MYAPAPAGYQYAGQQQRPYQQQPMQYQPGMQYQPTRSYYPQSVAIAGYNAANRFGYPMGISVASQPTNGIASLPVYRASDMIVAQPVDARSLFGNQPTTQRTNNLPQGYDYGGNQIVAGSFNGGGYAAYSPSGQPMTATRTSTGQWNYDYPAQRSTALAPAPASGPSWQQVEAYMQQYAKRLGIEPQPAGGGFAPGGAAASGGGDWWSTYGPGAQQGAGYGTYYEPGGSYGGGGGAAGYGGVAQSTGGVDPAAQAAYQNAMLRYQQAVEEGRQRAEADRAMAIEEARKIAGSFSDSTQGQQLQQVLNQIQSSNPYGPEWLAQSRSQQEDERMRQLAAAEETLRQHYGQMGRAVDPNVLALLRLKVAQGANADLRDLQLASTGQQFAANVTTAGALQNYVGAQSAAQQAASNALINILGNTQYTPPMDELTMLMSLGSTAALAPVGSGGGYYNSRQMNSAPAGYRWN